MDNCRYTRMPDIELRSIAGEHFLIVLHAGESKMFSLNGMGLWFWEHLAHETAPAALLQAMLHDYEVTEEVAAQEVERFLSYLVDKGLARCIAV